MFVVQLEEFRIFNDFHYSLLRRKHDSVYKWVRRALNESHLFGRLPYFKLWIPVWKINCSICLPAWYWKNTNTKTNILLYDPWYRSNCFFFFTFCFFFCTNSRNNLLNYSNTRVWNNDFLCMFVIFDH